MEYKIEDIIKHHIQLTSVNLMEIQLETKSVLKREDKIHRKISISSHSFTSSENEGNVDVELAINATINEEPHYFLKIVYRGQCKSDGSELKEGEFAYFLEVQAIKLIWPYFREILPGLLLKMGTEVFELPTMDVVKTISEKFNHGE